MGISRWRKNANKSKSVYCSDKEIKKEQNQMQNLWQDNCHYPTLTREAICDLMSLFGTRNEEIEGEMAVGSA